MNRIYSCDPRQVQTIRCCGKIHKRWRFTGATFSRVRENDASHRRRRATHPVVCKVCKQPLYWPKFDRSKISQVRRAERIEAYYDRKIEHRLAGKNALGVPLRRKNLLPISREEYNRRQLARYYARRDKFASKGLTTRGTKPVFKSRVTGIETAWKSLRASIVIPIDPMELLSGSLGRDGSSHALRGCSVIRRVKVTNAGRIHVANLLKIAHE